MPTHEMAYSPDAAMMGIFVHLEVTSFLQPFARNRLLHSEMAIKKTKLRQLITWSTYSYNQTSGFKNL